MTAPEISPNAMMAHMDLKLDKILGILARQGTHPLDEQIVYAADDEDWDR